MAIVCGSLVAATGTASAQERGYELVTPADGESYSAPANWWPLGVGTKALVVSDNGEEVYYDAGRGPGPSISYLDGTLPEDAFGATRGAGGWSSKWLSPYCIGVPNALTAPITCTGNLTGNASERGIDILAGGGGKVLMTTGDPIDPADVNGSADIYLGTPDGVRLLSRPEPDGDHVVSGPTPATVAATSDLRTVAWVTNAALLSEDTDEFGDLYADVDGELRLISTHENGGNGTCFGGNPCGSFGSAGAPMVQLSDDGSRVGFVTDKQLVDADTDENPELYLRDGETVRRLTDAPDDGATFMELSEMAPDGSRFVVLTNAPLTADDTDTGETDVFMIDSATAESTLLSPGTVEPGDGARFVFASPDASHAWFWTPEAIAGAPDDGARKIYEGDESGVTYVGSVPNDDSLTSGNLPWRRVASSDDGSSFAFSTRADLLPELDGNAVQDVYLWKDDSLSLLTQRPPGAPLANADLAGRLQLPFVIGRGITPDGSRVFFSSATPFVAEDTDGTRSDVYEWTAEGIELVSPPGSAPVDSIFAGSSADGEDVVFGTQESVVGWDNDGGQMDLYDARIGGGFPEPPPPPTPCAGDECQPPPNAPPGFSDPGSVSFTGPSSGSRGPGVARFSVAPIGKAALTRLIRSGTLVIRVQVSEPGVVRATASARVNRLLAMVGDARKRATKASTVHLRLRLAASARRELRRTGRLRLSLSVRFSKAPGSSNATLKLRARKGR